MSQYQIRYTHYTNFGVNQAPACADSDGYIAYRENYQDMPVSWWSEGEEWIEKQNRRIAEWRVGNSLIA